MPKSKLVLSKKHFRVFVTMDQLAEQLKTCRSSIDIAVARFLASARVKFAEKKIRTGKRGPLATAYKIR